MLTVVAELARQGVAVSIDTTRARVAAAALEAGAVLVNDVSGGRADPDMARVVAEAGVPWVLMHWRGHSREMAAAAVYDDPVAEVRRELLDRVDDALAAGVDRRAARARPRVRVRQGAAARPGPARAPRGVRRARVPAAGRRLAQALPGAGAHRRRRPGAPPPTSATRPRWPPRCSPPGGRLGVRVHAVAATVDAVRVVAAVRAAAQPPARLSGARRVSRG